MDDLLNGEHGDPDATNTVANTVRMMCQRCTATFRVDGKLLEVEIARLQSGTPVSSALPPGSQSFRFRDGESIIVWLNR